MSILSSEPSILTIFGITGDLARRKLLPALFHLAEDGLLPDTMKIVGVSRGSIDIDKLLADVRKEAAQSDSPAKKVALKWFTSSLSTITVDAANPEDYSALKDHLDSLEESTGTCLHRLFYLSVPTKAFTAIIEQLGANGLNRGCQHGTRESRVLVEKPFGQDLKSAQKLIKLMETSFTENQIYRIDHFLAKETVQNILRFRFENPLFSRNWDSTHISHIMVTASESIGIEGRVGFYEQVGALRDIVQSHLLQIIALITMEKPADLHSASAIHAQKQALFARMQSPEAGDTARGQYTGYTDEVNNQQSTAETFAAVKLSIDSERWCDMPILIRTGKALAEKVTEVVITFKDPHDSDCTNVLTIRIQPHEGIVLDLRIKKPGFDVEGVAHTQMSFCYADDINASHPDAYERVLVDAMRGHKTLFATSAEVLDSWRIIEPVLEAWEHNKVKLEKYKQGSWGPESGNVLAKKHGAKWLSGTPFVCTFHPQNVGKPE